MTLITRRFVQTRNILKLTSLRFHSTNEMVDSTLAKSLFPKLEDVKQQDMTPLNNSVVNRGKYFVGRSETGNLPVYTEYLGGGNKVVTEIKKIRGDPVQLKIDLQERLPFIDKKNWRVVAVSNKIVVKGNYCSEIKKVLSTTF
ncbi:hypothetical protein RI543_000955 [Arxiozyma heterogenica]|uniref:Large ribosomal subunit protein mL49 n=1 Tax=Arxiozyma heterogenica TaxID=278026 RepID=A0AAN7ZT70_9SACH|nr:hypothetical protein RI543_000955 [Kazachstania heterogenica]